MNIRTFNFNISLCMLQTASKIEYHGINYFDLEIERTQSHPNL